MRKLIQLTRKQRQELDELFNSLPFHGAIVGQIFKDGIHVFVIDEKKASAINKVVTGSDNNIISNSAKEAYEYSLKREKKL